MKGNKTMLSVQNVTKKFGRFTALDDISLRVKEGEIYGFIGPNGAGKTTTIRILLGILKANQGQAKIFGLDAWKDAVAIHKRLAYVPGDVNLWPNLTGGEVIDLFIRLRKNGSKKYAEELVERFEFDPSKKCRTYSKGNRQKVALVAAFASDADLYVLDEPTSGLDPLMEATFKECVAEVAAQGKSVLLSSHILSEVEALCDVVGIIRDGKIIEQGTMDELRHLTRTAVTVKTKKSIVKLKQSKFIHDFHQGAEGDYFSVDTEKLGQAVAFLSDHGILSLKCTPPSLEDLFMRHYEGTEAK